jgi:hypothetical protein
VPERAIERLVQSERRGVDGPSEPGGVGHLRLLLHQGHLPDGTSEETWLFVEERSLMLSVGPELQVVIPIEVLDTVMRRYGKPLAEDVTVSGPFLDLPGGRSLAVLRHRARYDVIARDFLVYAMAGQEPLAELATSIAGALRFLAR